MSDTLLKFAKNKEEIMKHKIEKPVRITNQKSDVFDNKKALLSYMLSQIEKKYQDKIKFIDNKFDYYGKIIELECGINIYCTIRDKFFEMFGKEFNLSGPGETLGERTIEKLKIKNVTSVVIGYPSTSYVYSIGLDEWLDYSKKRKTIRTNKSSGQINYCIPITLLRTFKDIKSEKS